MTVIDATAVRDPQDADQALAFCILHAEPAEVVPLHDEWCRTNLSTNCECTCTPVMLRRGAVA